MQAEGISIMTGTAQAPRTASTITRSAGGFESEQHLCVESANEMRRSSGGKADLYFEVQPAGMIDAPPNVDIKDRKKRIDIVLVRPGGKDGGAATLSAIEGKLALTLGAFHQAKRWLKYVDYSSILIPTPTLADRTVESWATVHKLCKQHGIGLTGASRRTGGSEIAEAVGAIAFEVILKPRRNRNPLRQYIIDSLCNAQREMNLPGAPGNTRHFDRRQTEWEPVRAYVATLEGMGSTAKEIKVECKLNHEQFLRLLKLAPEGKIAGIVTTETAGRTRFWTPENKP